jgi:hypothetical protein
MFVISGGLMVLPFVLAFITSYYTPTIGLACRSLTFLLYFVFQVWLGMIWLFDFITPLVWTKHVAWLPFGTYTEKRSMTEKGKDNESSTSGERCSCSQAVQDACPHPEGFLRVYGILKKAGHSTTANFQANLSALLRKVHSGG